MEVITASCPQCATQYQLTPDQLAVANGQVRCGVCMTIFQAIQQPPKMKSAPTTTNKPTSEKSSFVNEIDENFLNGIGDDDLFSDNSGLEKKDYSSKYTEIEKAKEEIVLSSEFKKEEKKDGLAFIDDLRNLDDDESWAEKLLDEEGFDLDKVLKEEPKKKVEPVREALGSSSTDFDFDDMDESLSLSKSEEDEFGFTEKETLVNRITPEPLVFQIFTRNPLWLTIALSSLTALGVLLIAAQLFFYQKSTLARDPEWRGFYESTCNILGCDLPDQYAIEDISTNNLTVKSHPHYRNSLIIDVILINHGNISQPFPNLELFFSDKDQKKIAGRQFKPSEYLRGELASTSMMPIRQSIHVALEINDPGENASSYSMNLTY